MDECKLSHKDIKTNEEFINTLHDEYNILFEDGSRKIKMSWGKVHDYLGITLDYCMKGQVNELMLSF